jgi:hypothetical protein
VSGSSVTYNGGSRVTWTLPAAPPRFQGDNLTPVERLVNHLEAGYEFDAAVFREVVKLGAALDDIGRVAREEGISTKAFIDAARHSDVSGWPEAARAFLKTDVPSVEQASMADDVPNARSQTATVRSHPASGLTDEVHAIDVTTLAVRPARPYIVEGLWQLHSVLGIAAEEGEGKTLLGEQFCRQALRGERVFDFFDLGQTPPQRILYIDTEMEEDDAKDRDDDARHRGLSVRPDQFYWYSPGGLTLDEDLVPIEGELERVRPDLVWIDSAINAVSNAEEGLPVKKFFNNLSYLMRSFQLLGIGLTFHPRKRAQGSNERRFDDLFGSREWKGRPNTVLWVEGSRITAWKNRGGRLNKLLKTEPGKRPYATLNRPGLSDEAAVPFTITLPQETSGESEGAIEAKVREVLAERPDELTKTALAEAVGGRKQDALAVVNRLIRDRAIVPNTPRAKLRLAEKPPGAVGWSTPGE